MLLKSWPVLVPVSRHWNWREDLIPGGLSSNCLNLYTAKYKAHQVYYTYKYSIFVCGTHYKDRHAGENTSSLR